MDIMRGITVRINNLLEEIKILFVVFLKTIFK